MWLRRFPHFAHCSVIHPRRLLTRRRSRAPLSFRSRGAPGTADDLARGGGRVLEQGDHGVRPVGDVVEVLLVPNPDEASDELVQLR